MCRMFVLQSFVNCTISSDLEWPWRSFACCRAFFEMQFDKHLCDISHGFKWHCTSCGPRISTTSSFTWLLAAPPLDTRPCILRFALVPGFVYRKVTMLTWAMLTQRSCCLLQRLPAARRQWVSWNSSSSVVDLPACWVPSRLSLLAAAVEYRGWNARHWAVAVVRKPRPTVNICNPDNCRVRLP